MKTVAGLVWAVRCMQTVTANSWQLQKARLLSPNMTDSLPDEFEVVVVGTGLVESCVAAAAARLGHTVLHVDTAKYYGGDWAAFTWEGLQEWRAQAGLGDQQQDEEDISEVGLEEGEERVKLADQETITDIRENCSFDCEEPINEPSTDDGDGGKEKTVSSRPSEEVRWTAEEFSKQSRRFNIDLAPRLLLARGDMVELLISSNISRYTEFKAVTRVLTRLEGRLEAVPSSRSDVFNTKHISVVEKRILMKFLTGVMQETEEEEEDTGKTFTEYLKLQKLSANLIHFVVHSIAMVPGESKVEVGLAATRRFLSSLGRFGPTPFLWPMYGAGELPQAFCRLAAVFGAVYYLGRGLGGLVTRAGRAAALLVGGRRVRCEKLLLPRARVPPALLPPAPHSEIQAARAVLVTRASLLPAEKEQLTFLSLPQESGAGPVQVVEAGPGAAACPRGLHLIHATSKGRPALVQTLQVQNIVKEEELLYSLEWVQHGSTAPPGTTLPNLWAATGPLPELDCDAALEQAKQIFQGMFPGEEFLPRAPDPEEIDIFGEEAAGEESKHEIEDVKENAIDKSTNEDSVIESGSTD